MKKFIYVVMALLLLTALAGCNVRNTAGYMPRITATTNHNGVYTADDRDNADNFRVDNNRTGNMDRNNYGLNIPKTGYNAGANVVVSPNGR